MFDERREEMKKALAFPTESKGLFGVEAADEITDIRLNKGAKSPYKKAPDTRRRRTPRYLVLFVVLCDRKAGIANSRKK